MCQHETIQISQDGEKTILCGDCGREFGHLTQDDDTLVAYATPEHNKVLVVGVKGDEARDETLTAEGVGVTMTEGFTLSYQHVYPCRECGWDGKCNADWQDNPEPCHS